MDPKRLVEDSSMVAHGNTARKWSGACSGRPEWPQLEFIRGGAVRSSDWPLDANWFAEHCTPMAHGATSAERQSARSGRPIGTFSSFNFGGLQSDDRHLGYEWFNEHSAI